MKFRCTQSLGLATLPDSCWRRGAKRQRRSLRATAALRRRLGSSRHYAGEEDRQNRESLRKDRNIFQLRAGGQR